MGAMAKRRRRRKAGRPRNIEAKRHPNNSVVRSERLEATKECHDKRVAALRKLAAKPIDFDDLKAMAKEGDAGWYIGRLRLVGKITQQQRDAAERYKSAIDAYKSALRVFDPPAEPKAMDIGKISGRINESDEDHQRRFERAKADYERLYHALADHGHNMVRTVTRALNDEEVDIETLRTGLEILSGV